MPGVDALWVGHFDLTNFMGIPGQFGHPDYLGGDRSDRRGVRAPRQDRRHFSPPTTTGRATTRRKGFRLMAYGVDQLMLQRALGHGLDVLRATTAKRHI